MVMMTGKLEGNISTFICNPGYELVGNETLTCQDDGQWSPLPPVCEPGMKNSNHSATLSVIFIRSVRCIHYSNRKLYTVAQQRKYYCFKCSLWTFSTWNILCS